MSNIKIKKTKIAILDRDGVINKNKVNNGYIGYEKDFYWEKGAKKTIKYLKKLNFKIFVITNQSGIARNFFKYSDVLKLHKSINLKLKKINTKIDGFYFCPHHVDGVIKKYSIKCKCRKPETNLFNKIKKNFNIDYDKSFMVGDQKTDMLFAKKIKIKGLLFKDGSLYKFIKEKLK
jgi:D-glycero-D-manno-heptose 1,7-bisphosphate phosphatase